jgi:hypothetical protein
MPGNVLREVLCLVVGFGFIAAVTVDVLWTCLGTHGGGPISAPVMSAVWKGAVRLHNRRPHHRLLSFAGSIILALLLILWIAMLWTGWTFIYSAKGDSLAEARSRQPATILGRVYYVGSMLSTSGTTEIVANGPRWRIVAALNAVTGIGTFTLAITFLLQVLSAVVQKRTFGACLSDMGGTPARIIGRAWNGEDFDSLTDQLINATGMLHTFTEQHLAYPVLHYFHSERERTAATLRVAALDELILLIAEGTKPEARLPPMVLDPLRAALEGFADALTEEFVDPAEEPPPPPKLSVLRDAGVPTVDDETFRRAVQNSEKSRRFFAGLLREDGWKWAKVNGE